MTSRERVLAVLQHKKPDRVPIYGWVRANLDEQISSTFGSVEAFEDHYEFDYAHLFGPPARFSRESLEELREGLNRPIEPADFLDIPYHDPDDSAGYADLIEAVRHHKAQRGRFVYVQTPGIFEALNGVFGIENHLAWLLLYADDLKAVYARQAEWNRKFAMNCLDIGIDMIHVSDDWGSERSLLFSPAVWWEMIYPYHKVTTEAVAARVPDTGGKPREQTLDELIESRVRHLSAYKDPAWAQRFLATVEKVRATESRVDAGSTALTRAVALNLSKLMSYKDEYEVARLYSDPGFKRKLDEAFEPGYSLRFNLAPPVVSLLTGSAGAPRKREFGAWMLTAFGMLARLKGLRGTALDVFGYTAERRMERRLIGEYEEMLARVLERLGGENLQAAVELAALPDAIRGFGHVKEAAVEQAEGRKAELMAAFH